MLQLPIWKIARPHIIACDLKYLFVISSLEFTLFVFSIHSILLCMIQSSSRKKYKKKTTLAYSQWKCFLKYLKLYSLSFQSGNVTCRRKGHSFVLYFYILLPALLHCCSHYNGSSLLVDGDRSLSLGLTFSCSGGKWHFFLGPPKHLNIMNATQFIF